MIKIFYHSKIGKSRRSKMTHNPSVKKGRIGSGGSHRKTSQSIKMLVKIIFLRVIV